MGALIHTKGTGYLMYFYNTEFEQNWRFHQNNAAAYQAAAVAAAGGTSAWVFMSTFYDPARRLYPLGPTPPSRLPEPSTEMGVLLQSSGILLRQSSRLVERYIRRSYYRADFRNFVRCQTRFSAKGRFRYLEWRTTGPGD